MIIDFNEEEFIKNIINTLIEYPNEDIYINNIPETVLKDVEEWLENIVLPCLNEYYSNGNLSIKIDIKKI